MSRLRTATVLAAGAMLLAVSLVGCGGRTYVDPASESAVAARKQTHDRIGPRVAELRAAPVRLVPLGEVAVNRCVRGQHNWKVDDPYDSRCGLDVVAAFAFDGEFVARAQQLDEALRELGWRGDGIAEALHYWDVCSGGSCRNFPDYNPANLPRASYHRGDEQLAVEFASAGSSPGDLEWLTGFSRERMRDSCGAYAYHCEVRGTPWAQPWRSARQEGRFLLVLSSSEAYATT